MAKINECKIESRVTSEVRTKTFGEKSLHEFSMSNSVSKNKDGTWPKSYLRCKKWNGTAPQKGQDIVAVGRIVGEVWEKDGITKDVTTFVIDSFEVVAQATPSQHQEQKRDGYQPPAKPTTEYADNGDELQF